jgi:hypothetical protein
MAVRMLMQWPGVTREQYEDVRGLVRWDTDTPTGAKLHVGGFDEAGAHITDIWESEEDFNRFVNDRLMPGVQQVGIAGQPNVRFVPLGAVYVPALGQSEQAQTL